MRGIKLRHHNLGKLLKECRNKQKYTQDTATAMLGLSSKQYLSRIENGAESLPIFKFKRACELYGISINKAVELASKDYQECLRDYLRGNN